MCGEGNGLIDTMSANPIFFNIIALTLCEALCQHPTYVMSISLPAIRMVGIVMLILKMKKLKIRKKTKEFT